MEKIKNLNHRYNLAAILISDDTVFSLSSEGAGAFLIRDGGFRQATSKQTVIPGDILVLASKKFLDYFPVESLLSRSSRLEKEVSVLPNAPTAAAILIHFGANI